MSRLAAAGLAVLSLLAAAPVHAQATSDGPAAGLALRVTMTPVARQTLGLTTDRAVASYAEGRAAMLALRLDDARAAFARLAADGEPAGGYGLETTALWAAMLAERGSEVDRFYALNDSLAEVAERLPASPSADWLRATVALHRALMLAREERYPRAGLAFRSACGRFRTLTARPDASPDARFGQGVCEVAGGSVPRKYRWLGRLVGFSGTIAGGLAHLEAAAAGGGAEAMEATAVLSVVDEMLNGGRLGAQAQLHALAEAHPGSPLLAYLDGYHHFTKRRAAEAEAAFRRASAALGAPGTTPLPTLQAHLGLALFRQDRFAEAAPLLERFARDARGHSLVAQATLHAGLAYEMSGDLRRAEALYRRVRAPRDYDSDLAALREAERRLAAPLTATGQRLLLGATAFDSGRYEEVVTLLQPLVVGTEATPVERAEAAYRSGRAFQSLKRWDDAVRHFRLATTNPGDPLARWGPWAHFHTGEVLEAMGDASGAREAYRVVLANEVEFDHSKALEQRARAALERVSR